MPLGEFELIDRYFRELGAARSDVRLGVGDDGALLEVPPDRQLVAAIDTLVEGIHFPHDSPAASVGHRALAVNLSDVAAMGAEPAWALLALTLPLAEERWLAEFSRGFGSLARRFRVALVGGDTTRGPRCVTVQILGSVERGTALRRSGAAPGDAVLVSGTPGDATAGLALEQARLEVADAVVDRELRARFLYPTPRVALGRRLRDYATACIDVSDGLLADAGKLARASGCGVALDYDQLPVSAALVQAVGAARARELALTGGDDYELLFCVPPARLAALLRDLPPAEWLYQRIGALRAQHGAIVERGGSVIDFSHLGFDHFAERG
ncbi:MAG TPA: thiamine-phosphate kinase [Steroidobacteraceae bacterium]|nr:thiamine-phosphate kinase [Steroidobacteraceae bacterium]